MPTIHIPRSNGRFDGNVPVQVNGTLMRIPIGVDYLASDAEVAALGDAGIPMQRTAVVADSILISTTRYGSRIPIGVNGKVVYVTTGTAFVPGPGVLDALDRKGIVYSAGPAYPYVNAETAALVSRMDVTPNDARKAVYDTLFSNLKSAGLMSKFDGLYLLAAHSAQAALLNLLGQDSGFTVGNTGFTADRGFQGDGATAIVRTGRKATDNGALFKMPDCHFGGVIQDPVIAGTANRCVASGGAIHAILINGIGTNASKYNIFDLANQSVTTPVLAGHYLARRVTASVSTLFRNAAVLRTKTELSAKIIDGSEFSCLAGIDEAGAMRDLSMHRQSAFYFGSALTDAEVSSLYSSLNRFLSAVGAEASI